MREVRIVQLRLGKRRRAVVDMGGIEFGKFTLQNAQRPTVTLVMRSRIKSGDRLANVLSRVRETVLENASHQDLPFEHVVRLGGFGIGGRVS